MNRPQDTNAVQLTIENRFAVFNINNPPVNAGSHTVRTGLLKAIQFASEQGVTAVILCGANKHFMAVSDLKEFGQPLLNPQLPEVLSALEQATFPIVAAIHGSTLGGGLELAMACDSGTAATGASLAMPEVTLGIVPGAGGTQRLPRLIGIAKAIDLICSGKRIGASHAEDIGLVDRVADNAVDAAYHLLKQQGYKKRLSMAKLPPEPHVDDIETATNRAIKRGKGAARRSCRLSA